MRGLHLVLQSESHTGIQGNERADGGANVAAAADSKEGMVKVDYKPQPHVWRMELCV